jgi:hypothetical protein
MYAKGSTCHMGSATVNKIIKMQINGIFQNIMYITRGDIALLT